MVVGDKRPGLESCLEGGAISEVELGRTEDVEPVEVALERG